MSSATALRKQRQRSAQKRLVIGRLATRRLPALWLRIKGWIMAVTAFIACPCHLPITLPLLAGLAAGSALGAWMARNTFLIYAVATVYFLGGGALAYKWLTKDAR